MKITRRAMLMLAGAASLTGIGLRGGARAAASAQPFFLVFDDVTAELPADRLRDLTAPFAELGIPVGFIVKSATTSGAPVPAADTVAGFLRQFLNDNPGLGEIIAWAPELAETEPYFQVRKASAARDQVASFFAAASPGGPALSRPLTIAGWDGMGSVKLDAVRAAGFRNLLLLSQKNDASTSETCMSATVCIRGSLRFPLSDAAYDIVPSLRAAIGTGDMIVLALSLDGLARIPPDDLRLRAASLADTIATEAQANRVFADLPREHVFWFAPRPERLIGLRVEAPAAGDVPARVAFAAFREALTGAAIPFSVSGSGTDTPDDSNADCPGPSAVPVTGDIACVFADQLSPDALNRLADRGVEVVAHPVGPHTQGFDANGVFHLTDDLALTSAPAPGWDLSGLDPFQDVVISVSASAYTDKEGRAAILGALTGAADTSGSSVRTIPDFARAILPDDPVYRTMIATLRSNVAQQPAAAGLSDQERSALTEDAAIAWGYFDRLTERETGLCPSTASFNADGAYYHRVLTMWDYGSLIEAVICSHEIGLIDDAEYKSRVAALLRSLPAETIAGLHLPSSKIESHRPASLEHDYNACDTGRLLSALADLDRHPLSKGAAAGVVATWDLQSTVRDGQLHSIVSGRFRSAFRSHCAHYATRAFGYWGISAATPYAEMRGETPADTRMSLLYEVARIGAFGAEPLLLEAVEMGASEPVAYLADVLLAAQIRSFGATDDLVCVSESPLDRAPWFTYQGLRVDASDDPWDVRSIDPSPAYATDAFRQSARVFSTKAAFLWAANSPGDYAARLLDYARQHGRASETGYSSGIYSSTGTAMRSYSDVNTNGVILQAIAYILRGRAPKHALSP